MAVTKLTTISSEYNWGENQLKELISDLSERFLNDYQSDHRPGDVRNYGHYFLGSIVISEKNEGRCRSLR